LNQHSSTATNHSLQRPHSCHSSALLRCLLVLWPGRGAQRLDGNAQLGEGQARPSLGPRARRAGQDDALAEPLDAAAPAEVSANARIAASRAIAAKVPELRNIVIAALHNWLNVLDIVRTRSHDGLCSEPARPASPAASAKATRGGGNR
jgi:hypothetical protein